ELPTAAPASPVVGSAAAATKACAELSPRVVRPRLPQAARRVDRAQIGPPGSMMRRPCAVHGEACAVCVEPPAWTRSLRSRWPRTAHSRSGDIPEHSPRAGGYVLG